VQWTLVLMVLALVAFPQSDPDQVAGVWRGESRCALERTACVNETVVYYITAIPDKADVVSIRADKIVDGQALTMGTGEWKHDAARHLLTWDTPRQTWLLKIEGNAIVGTLTLADKTIVRRVTLKKAPRRRRSRPRRQGAITRHAAR
jgi:hypothetical protein